MKKSNIKDLKAVILAAGRGERLRPLTAAVPKALLTVGGEPILGRTLALLRRAGVGSVVLVTGYRANRIQSFLRANHPGVKLSFVCNPVYASSNTLYSLWLARNLVGRSSFLLIDGDLVFDGTVLRSILRPARENVLACDSSVELDEEAVRAHGAANGHVTHIGKRLAPETRCLGESIGLARIDGRYSAHLFRCCDEFVRTRGGRSLYYEAAFQRSIDQGVPFRARDIAGAKWAEIDTLADLRRAEGMFHRTCGQSAKSAMLLGQR